MTTDSALRQENEMLREQVAMLRHQAGIDADDDFIVRCRDVFGISPNCARMLRALLSGRTVSTYGMMLASGNSEGDTNTIVVQMTRLRKQLVPHGLVVETIRHQGYRLAPGAKDRINQMLEAGKQ